MKLTVFLSVAGDKGKAAGADLKREIEALEFENSLRFSCFLYTVDQVAGPGLVNAYSEQIQRANYFVSVLTEEYTYHGRPHIENEVTVALQRDVEMRETHNANFVFLYAPKDGDRLSKRIPGLAGRVFAASVADLARAFLKNSPLAILTQQAFVPDFADWPNRFFNTDGSPDILLVLGHSGKESPPSAQEIRNLRISPMEEDLADRYQRGRPDRASPTLPTQSMRIAEFLPRLVQFLSTEYLALHPGTSTLPVIDTDIDWHLIRFRQATLAKHNLVCFGAGDTNWISRAILAYYGNLLPVAFDEPGGSHVIFYRSAHGEFPDGRQIEDKSGRVELGNLFQVPASKEYFGAVLLMLPNPWNVKKRAIISAGLTALGSQAAILALCERRLRVTSATGVPWARVIRGKEGTGDQEFRAIGYDVIA